MTKKKNKEILLPTSEDLNGRSKQLFQEVPIKKKKKERVNGVPRKKKYKRKAKKNLYLPQSRSKWLFWEVPVKKKEKGRLIAFL